MKPSVPSRAMSSSRPAQKPVTAPKIEPCVSATATSVTSTRSGEPPRIPISETIVTWTIVTKKKRTAAFAAASDHGICGRGFLLARTSTYWSDEKSTNGITWTSWNGSTSVWPTFVTRPIGMFRG